MQRGYGIIKTLAPLHIGTTAGEETGNLNLIFRDQFTQTGIVPGSSIRGRLRADMLERTKNEDDVKTLYGRGAGDDKKAENSGETTPVANNSDRQKNYQYESLVKLEHASIVWLPIFCPGQPIVWVSCKLLLERYKRIVGIKENVPEAGTSSQKLNKRKLFFNLGFLEVKHPGKNLSSWFPSKEELPAAIVEDNEMGMIHDMGLYRQSRVALAKYQKVVENYFNVEALPEGTILVFPLALKSKDNLWDNWRPLDNNKEGDIYLGGLESIGFGHCSMTLHLCEDK